MLGLVYRVVPPSVSRAARISASSLVVAQMGRAFQQAKDNEFHTAKRFMGQMMALNSPTEAAKRRLPGRARSEEVGS